MQSHTDGSMQAATGKGGPRIRLLVVPVLRDRWVFSVPHHAEALASHDTSPVSYLYLPSPSR